MSLSRRYGQVGYAWCGCYYIHPDSYQRVYLPQIQLESHTTILATTSRTTLQQNFVNLSKEAIKEAKYTFPLYDGVSIAQFKCTIADRVIVGIVKERHQARADYQEAVNKGQTAGLLEQSSNAADVFTTSIGNIAPGDNVRVEIVYLGELKNDAETDGARFTIPTVIAPRYGHQDGLSSTGLRSSVQRGMKITVDVILEQGVAIRGIQSPSHPISVSMGRTSAATDPDDDDFHNNLGSAMLSSSSTELDKDFVVVVQAKGQDTPRALLETHPTLPNQRVLMTTLVPKFNLPNESPEIVFIVDRSGSMMGKIHLVIEAMKVFLKSLPVSVKFNICSFGSSHSFLFPKSKTYDAQSLQVALDHIDPRSFKADYGGTEMMQPVKAALKKRYKDLPLEVMLLTDGEIWDQDALFRVVNEASKENARFFTLGIGSGASSSLVEGIARAGNGFSQWVDDGERIDKRLVRMLKGALMPHVKYQLEIKYPAPPDYAEDDFEIVESFDKSMRLVGENVASGSGGKQSSSPKKKIISLFQKDAKDEPTSPSAGRYDNLPIVEVPHVVQAPTQLPELYPHSRASLYLLLGPDAPQVAPSSVWLRGKSRHGDLELEVPVEDIGQGDTLHKLAVKKCMQDLEEGRGWLSEVKTANGKTLQSQNEGKWDLIVEREAVRLGVTFQVGGKFCSFVAINEKDKDKVQTEHENSETLLADYQNQAMLLGQQDKSQLLFGQASAAPGGYPPAGARARRAKMSKGFDTSAAGFLGGVGMPKRRVSDAERNKDAAKPAFGATSRPGFAKRITLNPQPSGGAMLEPTLSFGSNAPAPSAIQGFIAESIDSPPDPEMQIQQCAQPAPPPASAAYLAYNPTIENWGSRLQSAPYERTSVSCRRGVGISSAPMGMHEAHDEFDVASLTRPAELDDGKPMTALEKMQRLIDLQTFSGSWKITVALLSILKHNAVNSDTFKDEMTVMAALSTHLSEADRTKLGSEIAATICAIAWLEAVTSDEQEVWEMVVDKANQWLEGKIGQEQVRTLVAAMKTSLKA